MPYVHTLSIRQRFEAAHRLFKSVGDCKNLHGHSFEVRFVVGSANLVQGMVIDSDEVKKVVKPLINELDHATLLNSNDDSGLADVCQKNNFKYFLFEEDPTAEIIASHLFLRAKQLLPTLIRVEVKETENLLAYHEET